MSTRKEIVSGFYEQVDEESRLKRSRHGQLEYATTMAYIHRYANKGSRVLEVGAGTGRYSIALAREGMKVSAVELVESNLAVLRENSRGIENLESFQGDAVDLGRFADNSFDVTLVLGPMYHIYEPEDVNSAIDEAIRVTKPGGVILFAFISVFGIMYANYFQGNWAAGEEENCTKVASLVRYFVQNGGHQLQLNAVNRDALIDAQAHPEKYERLIVRIWGWSAYFVELDKCFQDHVIRRQEYRM